MSVRELVSSVSFCRDSSAIFPRIIKKTWKSVCFANELFEFARFHQACRNRCLNLAYRAIDFRHERKGNFLNFRPDLFEDEDGLSALYYYHFKPNDPHHTPAEEVLKMLSRALGPMLVWGSANIALGLCAHQVSLATLVVLTWGSFRWNENELLLAASTLRNENTEDGKFFREHPVHYLAFLVILFCSYLLVYSRMRNNVSEAMKTKCFEIADPYLNKIQILWEKEHYQALMNTERDIAESLEEPAKHQFALYMEDLRKAMQSNDFASVSVTRSKIDSLIYDNTWDSKREQIFRVAGDIF